MIWFRQNLREFLVVIGGRISLGLLSLVFIFSVLRYVDQKQFGTYSFLFSTASWLSILLFSAANEPMTRMVVNIEVGGKIHSITAGMAARSFAISLIGTSGMAFVVMATNPNFSNEANTIGLAIIVGILASAIGATGLISTYAIGMRYRMMNVLILNGQVTLRIAAVFLLVAIGISSPTMFFVGISVSGAMLLAVLIAIVAKKSSEATSKAKIVPHLRT